MKRLLLFIPLVLVACAEGDPENRASCGFAIMGAANKVLEQLQTGTKVLAEIPADFGGTVPARIPGYGTTAALVAESPDGPIVAYDGEGFPTVPGFGVILVEDSTDTFQGVLIYDLNPPMSYPILGGVSGGQLVVPLYGMRISWSAVSFPRCPLFAPIDTGAATVGESATS
jgi:hypothetical protein